MQTAIKFAFFCRTFMKTTLKNVTLLTFTEYQRAKRLVYFSRVVCDDAFACRGATQELFSPTLSVFCFTLSLTSL